MVGGAADRITGTSGASSSRISSARGVPSNSTIGARPCDRTGWTARAVKAMARAKCRVRFCMHNTIFGEARARLAARRSRNCVP